MKTKKTTSPTKQDEKTNRNWNKQVSVSPSIMNGVMIDSFIKSVAGEIPLEDIIEGLEENIKKVQSGEMASMEAMLVAQAQSLQAMFVSMGRKASSQTGLAQYTAMMNLALKAQSQSRATIQALTELKYPKQVAFVKQANISHGHQQVNNGNNAPSSHAHAQENPNQSNELLEVNHGSETMDVRTKATASRTDQAMAALEK